MHQLRNSILEGVNADPESILAKKGKSGTTKTGSLGSVEIPRAQGRSTHQREEDRFASSIELASASWRSEVHEVKIKNISSRGMQITTPHPANIGEVISVGL